MLLLSLVLSIEMTQAFTVEDQQNVSIENKLTKVGENNCERLCWNVLEAEIDAKRR